jgi:NAD(P)-dependent dehydrogenase (short-subunit alcohol dehydrogenase family)
MADEHETDRKLDGRIAVVTGGANGLGLAIARRLAASGAAIIVVDLPAQRPDLPAEWQYHAIDLSTEDASTQLADLAARLGKVDILVANAGVVPPWRRIADLDRAEWEKVMRINVWGVAASMATFGDALEASGHGAVVAMASINGFRAHPQQALYTASKHAVVGLVRAAALDLGPRGIRVNALAPGPIATDALKQRIATRHEAGGPSPEDALAALVDETALGRLATPEDVANAAHFLASDASAGMTGVILPVEAGMA